MAGGLDFKQERYHFDIDKVVAFFDIDMYIYYVISLASVVKLHTVKRVIVRTSFYRVCFTGNRCFFEIQFTYPLMKLKAFKDR